MEGNGGLSLYLPQNGVDGNALGSSRCAVEATDFERTCLWEGWHDRVSWVQVPVGSLGDAGEVNGLPVNVSVTFAVIEGVLVAFYHPISRMVDWSLIEAWKKKTFTGLLPGGDVNAMNFHNCVRTIRESNGIPVGRKPERRE